MPGVDDPRRGGGYDTVIATQHPLLGASPGHLMSAALSRVIPAAILASIAWA